MPISVRPEESLYSRAQPQTSSTLPDFLGVNEDKLNYPSDPLERLLTLKYPSVFLIRFAKYKKYDVYGCQLPLSKITKLFVFGFIRNEVSNPVKLQLCTTNWRSLHFRQYTAEQFEMIYKASPFEEVNWNLLLAHEIQKSHPDPIQDEHDTLCTYLKEDAHSSTYQFDKYLVSIESKFGR